MQKFNTWYLMTMRDTASRSLAAACQHFHIDVDFAQAILAMPLEQIHALANSGECLVVPRLTATQIRTVMTSHASGGHGCVVAANMR